jgi:hypothetical protein
MFYLHFFFLETRPRHRLRFRLLIVMIGRSFGWFRGVDTFVARADWFVL